MTLLVKRWYRSRRNQVIIIVVLICCLIYYTTLGDSLPREFDLDVTRRASLGPAKRVLVADLAPVVEATDFKRYIEQRLQEALKIDKGTGCEIPQMDPFNKEVTQFDKNLPKINCKGQDWVKCWHSQCRVVREILDTTKDITCTYRDIIYETDVKYHLGPAVEVFNGDPYVLVKSDHAKVKCTGRHVNTILPSKWTGHVAGFRSTISPKPPPEGREKSLNVLIFGFDSTSRNGFIRRMPHSYKYLEEELNATILKGYNIVGDGTPAALFPILTGMTELELPDVRKKLKNTGTLDSMPFIFYKLKDDGYRTAYFEDMPWIGTFQYRFNGFRYQPADHYLRSFYLEESASGGMWKFKDTRYCVGATPRYKLMMNLTDQFFRLDGKRFCFTFIADITHDDFNVISSADDDTVHFLKTFKEAGRLKDTLLIIMGDHGARYSNLRQTLQGKLEERLPLMAIILPEDLKRQRPDAQTTLQSNVDVLTTPHDIHATVLDVLGMTQHYNPYKVTGADYTRGMTLLEPVPRNRSCSEAGIEPHWCACISWENVTDAALAQRVASALLGYINQLTGPVRSKCVPRTLQAVGWVLRRRANSRMLSFQAAKDADGYVGKFGPAISLRSDMYQAKITVGPGHGVYEASLTHFKSSDTFEVDFRDISRTNAYNNEPHCISATHPHLNKYCYCNN